MTAASSALLLLFVATLGPCAEPEPLTSLVGTEAPPAPSAEAPRTLPKQQTQSTHAFMRDHAREAEDLRQGVVAGRFDIIHRVSAQLASDAWSPNLRPEYLPHVTAVRRAASAALDATSMQGAGAALGELGAACAGCHREQGGPPQPARAAVLSKGVGAMAAHAGAEQALWEGLFTPSQASWQSGAQRLAEAPELASDIDDVNALASHLRDLAQDAGRGAPSAYAYGRILATCATCHRRLSIEPH